MATNQPAAACSTAGSPFDAMIAGGHVFWGAARPQRIAVFFLFLLALLMLPFGRTAPDAGGLLAPLTVDSGYLFRQRPAADFFSVYDAGARAIRGQDPYGVNRDEGREGVRAPYVATFRYLPVTAYWLAAPLNILPPWPAYCGWVLLEFTLLIANFLLCVGRQPRNLLLFALIWFAWFPVIAELHMGQFTIFMAAMMLWAFDGLFAGSRCVPTAWAFAVLLKVYPIAMAPSLFLWGRRRLVIAVVLVAAGTTLLWKAFIPSDIDEGLGNRGVAGRVVGQMRQPYGGAQGVQEMVNAMLWKATGRSFSEPLADSLPALRDPVFVTNAIVLAAFGVLCLWALIRTRHGPSPAAIGLLWLAWFFAYVDCWEHHYVLVQALIALLLMRGVIGGRLALLCYLCAGAPSLWWVWQRTGYAGNTLTETIGLLYFVQRPIAIFALTWVCAVAVKREPSPTFPYSTHS